MASSPPNVLGNASAASSFQYEPLASTAHIRLLQIHHDKEHLPSSSWKANNPIITHYELIEAALECRVDLPAIESAAHVSHRANYVPISYTWGLGGRTMSLELGCAAPGSTTKGTVSVTAEVHDMLPFVSQRALQLGQSRIWIDQVCIDQENQAEREAQVALMGHIYAQANLVSVWLGSEDVHATKVSAYLKNPAEALKQDREDSTASKGPSTSSADSEGNEGGLEQAVHQLMSGHWFQRGWVVQEVVLPGNVEFLTGPQIFTFGDLVRLTSLVPHPGSRVILGRRQKIISTDMVSHGYDNFLQMVDLRQRISQDSTFRLYAYEVALSDIASTCKLTDERDRCYAFLGFHADKAVSIRPNYSLSVNEVYMDVAGSIIEGSRSLRLFERVFPFTSEHMHRPSWVPPWWEARRVATFGSPLLGEPFTASLERPHVPTPSTATSNLLVKGRIVDSIGDGEVPNRYKNMLVEPGYAIKADRHIMSIALLLDYANALHEMSPVLDFPVAPVLADGRLDHTKGVEKVLQVSLADLAVDSTTRQYLPLDNPTEPVSYDQIIRLLAVSEQLEIDDRDLNAIEEQAKNSESDSSETLDQVAMARVRVQNFRNELDEQRGWVAFRNAARNLVNRYLLVTQERRLGLVPKVAFKGDVIAIVHGSSIPLVLRPVKDNEYKLIGQCYIDGLMRGEVVSWNEDEADALTLV